MGLPTYLDIVLLSAAFGTLYVCVNSVSYRTDEYKRRLYVSAMLDGVIIGLCWF